MRLIFSPRAARARDVSIALQHVWGIDAPFDLCNFLQAVKKFASGLFRAWLQFQTECQ